MSTPQRRTHTSVIDQITAQPHRFEFFQAVRMLQHWLGEPQRGDFVPSQLRFRNSLSLSFPASEIESLQVRWAESGSDAALVPMDAISRVEIVPAIMGLLGVTGALPTVYTDAIAQRELYQRDRAARAFLDIFSHRAVSLFYAAWKKGRLHLQYEDSEDRRFIPVVLSLAGLGEAAFRQRLGAPQGGVHDESLAYFAGTLQQRVLSARQLEQLLRQYLRVPARIEQFLGRWYRLPTAAQTALGCTNGVLGKNSLLGNRVWQRDLRVRVVLGPLDHDRFQRFLPGQKGMFALRQLLTLLNGVSLEFEINLVLQATAVKGTTLSSRRAPVMGRLGWDTYLLSGVNTEDRCDVRYDIHADELD